MNINNDAKQEFDSLEHETIYKFLTAEEITYETELDNNIPYEASFEKAIEKNKFKFVITFIKRFIRKYLF